MKVAFATTDGVHVDEHFGRSGRFVVFRFTRDGYTAQDDIVLAQGRDNTVEGSRGEGALHEGAVIRKIELLADCDVIYMTQIGGPSAARLIRKGIMPVKVREPVPIESEALKLMEVIRKNPPPWIRKALEKEGKEE